MTEGTRIAICLTGYLSEVTKRYPEGTKIPSKSLVHLQFTPRNRNTQASLQYTRRYPLQHKIQARQLCDEHLDSHYAAALFKYFKEYAVKLNMDQVDVKSLSHLHDPGLRMRCDHPSCGIGEWTR